MKEETQVQDNLDDGISLIDGRLKFRDDSAFKAHLNWIFENQSNFKVVADKNKSLGFKSMTEYFLEGMKLEEADPKFAEYVANYPNVFLKEPCDSSILYFLPHSKIVCYIANVDGVYQIGDNVYRIEQNYIYKTNESKLEKLFFPKDQISKQDVNVLLSNPRYNSKYDYGQHTENFHNDNRFRIVSSVREYILEYARFYDLFTNPQKRTLGVYLRANFNTRAAHNYGQLYYANCPTCPMDYLTPNIEENTGYTQDVVRMMGSDVFANLSQSYCPGYSRGRLIDGTTEFIYIEWADLLEDPASWTVYHLNEEINPF